MRLRLVGRLNPLFSDPSQKIEATLEGYSIHELLIYLCQNLSLLEKLYFLLKKIKNLILVINKETPSLLVKLC